MLNWLLRQEFLRFPLNTSLEWRPHQIIEQESSVDKQRKTENLKPLERLPAESERDHPDEERAASVDGRARRRRDSARDTEAKEVEAAANC
jgi:hypothetical protein